MDKLNRGVSPEGTLPLSRRRLLQSLPLLLVAPPLLAQTASVPIAVQKLHSFGIRVRDVGRSVAFYQDLFAAPVQARQGDTVCLRIGAGPRFFSIAPVVGDEEPSISHVGLSVAGFNLERLRDQLDALGLSGTTPPLPGQDRLGLAMRHWVSDRGQTAGGRSFGSRDLFFADHEGIFYQLHAEDFCGGLGEMGNACNNVEAAPGPGMFELLDLSHFTNFMSNRDQANGFITQAFGKQYQAYQGPGAPIIGVGDGIQFLMYTGGRETEPPTQAGSINHVCFSVTDFDVERILQRLTDYGLSAREEAANTGPLMHWISMRMANRGGAEEGTPELYFSDPDGLRIQLQDAGYCGGGGYLGNECPDLA